MPVVAGYAVFTPSRESREKRKVKENMAGPIPNFGPGIVASDEATQIGCVYCLGENVEAPSSFGTVYMWQGTSMCSRHIRTIVMGATSATTNPAG